MRRTTDVVLMCGVFAIGASGLVGCGNQEPAAEPDEPTGNAQVAPQVVSPLEMLPGEPAEPVDESVAESVAEREARADAPDRSSAEPEASADVERVVEAPVEPRPAAPEFVPVDASAVNAIHREAGRSAFPNPGETVVEQIVAKKLSSEDQFVAEVDPDDIPAVVPWNQAGQYIGYTITVEGTIIDIGQSRDGNVNFLNFHKDWRGKFYMVIFDDLAKTLPTSVDATFRGKTLRVTGEVEDHRGRPQIKILSMDQVQVVGD